MKGRGETKEAKIGGNITIQKIKGVKKSGKDRRVLKFGG